jgi:PKD repeat protein
MGTEPFSPVRIPPRSGLSGEKGSVPISSEWSWEFGDGDKSDRNPSEHAYAKEGIYVVIVTAKTDEGDGATKTTVEVIGGERTRVWQ